MFHAAHRKRVAPYLVRATLTVFNQVHGAMMQDRDKWIDRLPTQVSVMWWIKAGERPTIAEAREKIALINSIDRQHRRLILSVILGGRVCWGSR